MNAYNIICKFLDKIMTIDHCLSFLVYKTATKKVTAPFEEYRLRLIYEDRRTDQSHSSYIKDDYLYLGDHFRKNHEKYTDGREFIFKSEDLLIVKQIMFMIIEHYIWWSHDGENGLSPDEEESYLESLEDLSLTQFEEEVDWIEKQIPGFSWKDFQNMRKLDSFKNKK